MSQRGLGCLNSCYFCGAPCDNSNSGHTDPCKSDLHRVIGAMGVKEIRVDGNFFKNDDNCNKIINTELKWIRHETVFIECEEFKVTEENDTKSVTELMKDLLPVCNWEIRADSTFDSGDVFW